MQSNLHHTRLDLLQIVTQPAITCSKLTTETLEQGVKYVQSYQNILVSLLLTLNISYTCSGVSILKFEQVNTGWKSRTA